MKNIRKGELCNEKTEKYNICVKNKCTQKEEQMIWYNNKKVAPRTKTKNS